MVTKKTLLEKKNSFLGQSEGDVNDDRPVIQLKRRSLVDHLTLWLEDFFETILRKGEKMVEKLPVDKAEQRAIKSSMTSISNRISSWSSRISRNITDAFSAFVLFGVLPLLPLDYFPEPLSGLKPFHSLNRDPISDRDTTGLHQCIDIFELLQIFPMERTWLISVCKT